MLEKRFAAVPSQLFTTNGGANGSVAVADTTLFKVKQQVVITAAGQTNLELEIKRIVSSTAMIVGPISGSINTFTDISAYTTAASAAIFANEQRRPTITGDEFERATYEEEPTVAKRTILVDEQGNRVNAQNPLPIFGQISAQSLPLPTGAATAANQTDGSQKTQVTVLPALPAGSNTIGRVAQGVGIDSNLHWHVETPCHIDVNNSSSTPLAANGVFTGTATETLNASQVMVSAFSNVASATEGLSLQFSSDGTNWDHFQTGTVTAGVARNLSVNVIARYFRVVYTNGGTIQGSFRMQVLLKPVPSNGSVSDIGIVPKNGDEAITTQSVIVGVTTAGGGHYVPVKVNPSGALTVDATQATSPWVISATSLPLPTGAATSALQTTSNANLASLDYKLPPLTLAAFGELLTADLVVKSAWRFDYGINSYLVTPTIANGGTVTTNQSRAVLSTSAAVNGSAKIETRNQLRYVPGVGGLARFTSVFAAGTASSQQIIGIGTADDGFFFGYDGTSFGIMRRRAGSDVWVPQASWNGEALGETLNPQFGNIYQIRFQWLGYGLIRFYVFDKTVGRFACVHVINYPNTSALTHTLNPTFPLMAEIKNTGNNTNLLMYTPSALGALEGGRDGVSLDPLAVPRSFDTTVAIAATTVQHLFTLQNKAAAYTGPVSNRAPIKINSIDLYRTAGGVITNTIKLWRNATTAGVLTFADVSTADSPAATSTTTTTITSTDSTRTYGMDGTSNSRSIDLSKEDFLVYPGETFSMSTTNGTAGSLTFAFSVNWTELF